MVEGGGAESPLSNFALIIKLSRYIDYHVRVKMTPLILILNDCSNHVLDIFCLF